MLLAIALGWSVVNKGGVYPSDLSVTLLAVGTISLFYWILEKQQGRPLLKPWLRFSIVALPAYFVFQLIPFPLAVLRLFSPTRAMLTTALAPALPSIHFAPLSTSPVQTVFWLFATLGYIAVFLLVRQLAWRFTVYPWAVLVPLLLISAIESLIGILQSSAGLAAGSVTGTYTNHDHYAGSLEMTLPIAVLYGVAIFRVGRSILACCLWALAGLFLLAISYSLSRSGFLISICVLLFIAALSFRPHLPSRPKRWLAFAGLGVAALLVVAALPTRQLVERFALFAPAGGPSPGLRLQLWRDTLPLIAEFPLFGCGLGAYESNFLRFQTAGSAFAIEMAHNDYLQYLADLGIVGFVILLAIVFGVVGQILSRHPDENRRSLQIACAGSMLAILLHSFVDFNMHIPANAMTLAWIAAAGLSASRSPSRPERLS
jgi:O-antigen ligase